MQGGGGGGGTRSIVISRWPLGVQVGGASPSVCGPRRTTPATTKLVKNNCLLLQLLNIMERAMREYLKLDV